MGLAAGGPATPFACGCRTLSVVAQPGHLTRLGLFHGISVSIPAQCGVSSTPPVTAFWLPVGIGAVQE
jgi:hypothetical protein